MGERSWTNSKRRFCGDADRLVETLAGRGKNGEQRCKRYGPLSRLEPAGAEISLPGSENHSIRARDHGYRSRDRHNQGRLFARNLHSKHEPLPDRVADKPRSGAGVRSAGGGKFSETKRWLRISGTRLCHFAVKPIRPKPARDPAWSKMCLVKLTASRGTNEDKRK